MSFAISPGVCGSIGATLSMVPLLKTWPAAWYKTSMPRCTPISPNFRKKQTLVLPYHHYFVPVTKDCHNVWQCPKLSIVCWHKPIKHWSCTIGSNGEQWRLASRFFPTSVDDTSSTDSSFSAPLTIRTHHYPHWRMKQSPHLHLTTPPSWQTYDIQELWSCPTFDS